MRHYELLPTVKKDQSGVVGFEMVAEDYDWQESSAKDVARHLSSTLLNAVNPEQCQPEIRRPASVCGGSYFIGICLLLADFRKL